MKGDSVKYFSQSQYILQYCQKRIKSVKRKIYDRTTTTKKAIVFNLLGKKPINLYLLLTAISLYRRENKISMVNINKLRLGINLEHKNKRNIFESLAQFYESF